MRFALPPACGLKYYERIMNGGSATRGSMAPVTGPAARCRAASQRGSVAPMPRAVFSRWGRLWGGKCPPLPGECRSPRSPNLFIVRHLGTEVGIPGRLLCRAIPPHNTSDPRRRVGSNCYAVAHGLITSGNRKRLEPLRLFFSTSSRRWQILRAANYVAPSHHIISTTTPAPAGNLICCAAGAACSGAGG